MTQAQQAVEDAIEGGWCLSHIQVDIALQKAMMKDWCFNQHPEPFEITTALLDHKFWQAVGKTRGWKHEDSRDVNNQPNGEWVDKWVDFIIYRADGKTIEDSLAAISN